MDSIFADIVICICLLGLFATIGITIFSVVHSQKANRRPERENGIPVRLVGLSTIALVLAIALPTLLIGNFTDMCIITSIALLLISSGCVLFGKFITLRLRKRV